MSKTNSSRTGPCMMYIIPQFFPPKSLMSRDICLKHVAKIILMTSEGRDRSEDIWSRGQPSAFTLFQQQSYATSRSGESDHQKYPDILRVGERLFSPQCISHVDEVTSPDSPKTSLKLSWFASHCPCRVTGLCRDILVSVFQIIFLFLFLNYFLSCVASPVFITNDTCHLCYWDKGSLDPEQTRLKTLWRGWARAKCIEMVGTDKVISSVSAEWRG